MKITEIVTEDISRRGFLTTAGVGGALASAYSLGGIYSWVADQKIAQAVARDKAEKDADISSDKRKVTAVSGNSCYDNSYKFHKYIGDMHHLGYSRRYIESEISKLSPKLVPMANKISELLEREKPPSGYTNSEYEQIARAFAKGACQ